MNSLGYDAAGNLKNEGHQIYASGTNLNQNYNGDGVRVKKTENGATTYYLRSTVLGGQVVAEMNDSGAWTRGYVYQGGSLLAVQQGNSVNWMHEDPVAKSKRVTDATGNVVSMVELDPWGGNTNRNNNSGFQPRQFTSYDRDANAGDEAMFRRYNRWWSRFDQPDPYDGSYDLTNPQSLNRYAYVQSDPVNFVDPTGLEECVVLWVGATRYLALCFPDRNRDPNPGGSGGTGPDGRGGGVGGTRLQNPHPTPPAQQQPNQGNQQKEFDNCIKQAIANNSIMPTAKAALGVGLVAGAAYIYIRGIPTIGTIGLLPAAASLARGGSPLGALDRWKLGGQAALAPALLGTELIKRGAREGRAQSAEFNRRIKECEAKYPKAQHSPFYVCC